jgi:phosphatidylserine decarboxylase
LKSVLRFFGMAEWGGDELLIAALACFSSAYALGMWFHPLLALIPLVPLAIVVWFFRDPERTTPQEPQAFVSPADGTVSDIEELDENEFLRCRALRIGIFLSPLNVHVNRAPCAGTVLFVRHKTGEFLPAYNPEAPTRNESVCLGMQTPEGLRLMVRQVTGVLARRIICDAQIGDQLSSGQRYGMIKFGSRTELYVPVSAEGTALVKIGDKVTGGETLICRVKSMQAGAQAAQEALAAQRLEVEVVRSPSCS